MNNRLKLNLRLEFSFASSHEHVFGSDPCLEVTCRLVLYSEKTQEGSKFSVCFKSNRCNKMYYNYLMNA